MVDPIIQEKVKSKKKSIAINYDNKQSESELEYAVLTQSSPEEDFDTIIISRYTVDRENEENLIQNTIKIKY